MRVALVCGRYLPDRDGVADYVRQLAQALPDAGATPVAKKDDKRPGACG